MQVSPVFFRANKFSALPAKPIAVPAKPIALPAKPIALPAKPITLPAKPGGPRAMCLSIQQNSPEYVALCPSLQAASGLCRAS
jgi:hypothetical protein